MEDRLEKQIAFIREIDKEKFIQRMTLLTDGKRRENDAEHAWHLAMMCFLLEEYANEDIDVLHTMEMVLIHDIVEIDAGDTFAYDYKAQETQAEREMAAAKRLFGILPEDQGKKLMDLWQEFEAYETPEACFAHTLDNFQPVMLNAATEGKSWKKWGATKAKVLKRNEKSQLGSKTFGIILTSTLLNQIYRREISRRKKNDTSKRNKIFTCGTDYRVFRSWKDNLIK